jgi:hypothetical protein
MKGTQTEAGMSTNEGGRGILRKFVTRGMGNSDNLQGMVIHKVIKPYF